MQHHVDDGQQRLLVLTHHAQRLLRAARHHTLCLRHSHGVDHLACEPERDLLRNGQLPPLVEDHPEINVNQLATPLPVLSDQDVACVPVAEPDDEACHAGRRHTSRVRQTHLEPLLRALGALEKKMSEHGLGLAPDELEGGNLLGDILLRGIFDLTPAVLVGHPARIIPCPQGLVVDARARSENCPKRGCVVHPLDEPRRWVQRDHTIRAHVELALAARDIALEEDAEDGEELR
mmetsp:Transcript_26969/g.54785  ORF Transcript_26969/g.54785 Transcript_26969/m.54785 type:complete len:234 (+) Transcript_26969:169-870(+)